MRHRRAERLALRAEAALAAGCIEDASACLAEAKTLAPELPQLDAIERSLLAAETVAPELPPTAAIEHIPQEPKVLAPELTHFNARDESLAESTAAVISPPASRSRLAITVFSAVALTAALAAWFVVPIDDFLTDSPRVAETTPAAATSEPAAPPAAPAPTAPAEPQPLPPSAVFARETAAAASEATRRVEPDAPVETARPLGTAGSPAPKPGVSPETAARATNSGTAAAPAPRLPLVAPASRGVTMQLPGESAPVQATVPAPSTYAIPSAPAAVPAAAPPGETRDLPTIPAAPPTAEPAPKPAPAEASQESAVRSVLNGYAAAYSALDADAAQRVWPGVNRSALSRAFDSLASQRISLNDCRIQAGAVRATASCAGTATWAPKIGGGGTHSEARQWTFDLARSGDRWQIVSARVQNR